MEQEELYMDQDKLFSLLPTKVVAEDDVEKTIEEQRGIIKAGNTFVSKLSINRYLNKKLAEFDLDERLSFFSDLTYDDFIINENQLYLDLDIETFAVILEEEFGLESMYDLDNFYIEELLNGRDIMVKDVTVDGEGGTMSFTDVLQRFVFTRMSMGMGDTPPLSLMLTAKKALLGSYLAKKNVESLLNGQREIYDFSVLM